VVAPGTSFVGRVGVLGKEKHMAKDRWALALAVVGLGVVVVPASSLAASPAWCSAHKDSRLDSDLNSALTSDDVNWAVYALVSATCQPDSEASSRQKDVAAARAKWSTRLAMAEGDWADAAAWAAEDQSTRHSTSLRNDQPKRAWSSLDPVGQYIALNFDLANDYDADYLADALEPRLSEAGRLAYIGWCLRSRNENAVLWAMCQPDIDAFNVKKLSDELRADKDHSGYERFTIRLNAYRFRSDLAEHAKAVKAKKGEDPAYAKMFEIAAATRKDWAAKRSANAALYDLALAMDDARVTNSRKSFAGCEDKTEAAFKAAVSAIPAAKYGNIRDEMPNDVLDKAATLIVGEPRGYLAASAYYVCMAAGQPDVVVRYLGSAMERWPGFRGPRTSAMSAILGAGLQLDDRGAEIEYPSVRRGWLSQSRSSNGGGWGLVSKVKAGADGVRVEFAPKMVKVPQCQQYETRNRIAGIRADGTFIRESTCRKWANVSIDRRSSPQTVKSSYGAGLKAKTEVQILESTVIAVWNKAGSALPNFVFGAPVK